jgi:hypothetical protein
MTAKATTITKHLHHILLLKPKIPPYDRVLGL